MIDSGTIQILQKIVTEMGFDFVCQDPQAFAGAILDMCNADDVKLLTNVLRSNYRVQLMAFFRDGDASAATWAQQKTFLIDESGMSAENANGVLDTLWQAMGWQRPKPSQPEPEPAKAAAPKVDPKYKKEYIDTSKLSAHTEAVPPKVAPKYKKEYAGSGQSASGSVPPKVAPTYKKEYAGSGQSASGAVHEYPPSHKVTHDLGQSDLPHKEADADRVNVGGAVEAQPAAQPQQGRSKWIPLLISAALVFLAYQLNQGNSTDGVFARIQNGEYTQMLYLAAPFIATLFVCVKGCPGILKGLGAVVLGFVAFFNWFAFFYWLDRNILHLGLILGETNASDLLTVIMIFIGVPVGIAALKACSHVGD